MVLTLVTSSPLKYRPVNSFHTEFPKGLRVFHGLLSLPFNIWTGSIWTNLMHVAHTDTTVQIVPVIWVSDWVGHRFSMANTVTWLCAIFEIRALTYWLLHQPLLAVCVSGDLRLVHHFCYGNYVYRTVCFLWGNWDPVPSMWGTGWGRRSSWSLRCNTTSS